MPYDLKRLEQITVEAGFGENRFTMKRGSFAYRRTLRGMQKLQMRQNEACPGGFVLHYAFPNGADAGRLRVTLGENRADLVWEEAEGAPGADEAAARGAAAKDGTQKAAKAPGAAAKDNTAKGAAATGPAVNRWRIGLPADAGEHYYGCGETYSKLDLRGEKVRIWVAEHQNTSRISKKIVREKLFGRRPQRVLPFSRYESYYAQPTFVSSGRYFVHADTSAFAEFDFTRPGAVTLELQQPPRLTLGWDEDFPQVSRRLSDLLGRPRRLPGWLHDGGIFAVQEGCDAVDGKLARAAEAGVKVNGVWCQDWCGCRRTGFGYQVMWNWHWDDALYPNLPEKIKEWKARGVRFLGYINPFLAIEKELYREAAQKGYCVKDREGRDYLVTITTFPAAMIDLTNPEAYAWYKTIIQKNMIDIGMGGWMADFGEYLPVDSVLYSGEDPALVHNRWPAIWAQLNREAIRERGAEEDVFFFTRAGHTGTIAHSDMMWTGDQHVDWSVDDGLPSVIPATLSLAMSGFPIAHSDVGGYTTIMHMCRSRELLMRWAEMNAFSPLFRSHEGNQPARNVQFDADAGLLAHMARCTAMYTALRDYLLVCEQEACAAGIPVMRPLFYHYDEAPLYTEKGEYLLGRDILVAPVLEEGAAQRSCLLPQDRWVHLFTGERYTGGRVSVAAPIGTPPVFVREESPWCETLRSLEIFAN